MKFENVVNFSEIESLPNKNALYGIFKNDVLLYIGSTFGLKSRFIAHKYSELYQEATHIKFTIYDNYSINKLKIDEINYIRKFKPMVNSGLKARSTKRFRCLYTRNYIFENEQPTIISKTYQLLWGYIEHSFGKINACREIADATSLTFTWVYNFSTGHGKVDINKIEKLYKHLTNCELPIDSDVLITQPTGQQRTDSLYNNLMRSNEIKINEKEEYKYNRTVARLLEFCAELEKELKDALS